MSNIFRSSKTYLANELNRFTFTTDIEEARRFESIKEAEEFADKTFIREAIFKIETIYSK